jgi:hypothetical protein
MQRFTGETDCDEYACPDEYESTDKHACPNEYIGPDEYKSPNHDGACHHQHTHAARQQFWQEAGR